MGLCALPLRTLGQFRRTLGLGPRTAASAFGGDIRPIYSPALVAFVGGGGGGLSISIGAVAAWFPLGPHEAYHPWYHASPAYCNRVNVTNIYNTNVTEIHNTYINRTVNVYNTTNVTNVTYVNRNVATVVVPQHAFASGQSIAQAQRVQLTPQVRAQLNTAPIVPHPLVTPATAIVAAKAPARAVPPVQARPVVETRQGFERAGSPGTPVRAPLPPAAVNRASGQPAPTAPQPINRAGFPQQRQAQVIAPAPIAHPTPTAQVPTNNRPTPEVYAARPSAPVQPVMAHPAPTPQAIAPGPSNSLNRRPYALNRLRPSSSGRLHDRPTSRARWSTKHHPRPFSRLSTSRGAPFNPSTPAVPWDRNRWTTCAMAVPLARLNNPKHHSPAACASPELSPTT